ncbi:hypothetical protein RHSP_19766 [Rhizobium freirei PRF 81]|uniref:Uncharacterized protein n=1 Tax=Rhizobium freirei PRF 81 TaxID=363754 RepID=N6V057_9HYPH|nr:hypothetical protein RHSP_19766 [Rhizobium freirei PRF 81]
MKDEKNAKYEGDGRQRENLGRIPGPFVAAERQHQQEARRAARQQRGAEIIDATAARLVGTLERAADHHKGDGADRQVDVEDPVPGQQIGDNAAGDGADDAADGEDGGDRALIAPTPSRRHEVADDDLCQRHQAAGADALDRPEDDELHQRLRHAAQNGAEQEDQDCRIDHRLAAILVAELAVERHGTGGGKHIGADNPGEVRQPAEIADDTGQGGGDDALVDGAKTENDHQAENDGADFAAIWRIVRCGCRLRSCLQALTAHCPISSSGAIAARMAARASGDSLASSDASQSVRFCFRACMSSLPFSVAIRPLRLRSLGSGSERVTRPSRSIAFTCPEIVGPRSFSIRASSATPMPGCRMTATSSRACSGDSPGSSLSRRSCRYRRCSAGRNASARAWASSSPGWRSVWGIESWISIDR